MVTYHNIPANLTEETYDELAEAVKNAKPIHFEDLDDYFGPSAKEDDDETV